MQRKSPLYDCKTAICLIASMSILMSAGLAGAKERSQFKGDLRNDGIVLGASGEIRGSFKASKAKMSVRVRDLAPDTEHTLLVDGQVEAVFMTDEDGNAKVKLKTTSLDRTRQLDFEPREHMLEVHDGVTVVLSLDLSDDWDDLELKVKEETNLTIHELDSRATVRARHKVRLDGTERFNVKAKRLPEGTYVLYVDGIERATVMASGSKGKASVAFESVPTRESHNLLDFDPRSAEIAVVRDGVVFASGEMQSQVRNVNVCDELRKDAYLAPQIGAPLAGRAEVKWRQDSDCEREFEIELENMHEDRVYDLYVDGVYEGTLNGDDDEYELEFKANVDADEYDDDEHHLTFDPTAGVIEIREGDTVIFSDTLDAALATNSGGACREIEIDAHLLTLDSASDAQAYGEFRIRENCRRSFKIDLSGAPAGNYDVSVDGVVEGGFSVATNTGEIEFESNADEDEDRLDFEPRLELIEVSKDGVVIFSRTFPQ